MDPAFTAIGRPVLEWAVRVNRSHYDKDTEQNNLLKEAWQAHIGDMLITNKEGGDLWNKVRGPATAVMASLCGIGWKPRAYYQWETDIGETDNGGTDNGEPCHYHKQKLNQICRLSSPICYFAKFLGFFFNTGFWPSCMDYYN